MLLNRNVIKHLPKHGTTPNKRITQTTRSLVPRSRNVGAGMVLLAIPLTDLLVNKQSKKKKI